MNTQDKELLLKDLCARLPYGVIVHIKLNHNIYGLEYNSLLHGFMLSENVGISQLDGYTKFINLNEDEVKPYLHSMSNMTEEEEREFEETLQYTQYTLESYDWLNTHHFDYRGLITMGLALEAPKGMYKTE